MTNEELERLNAEADALLAEYRLRWYHGDPTAEAAKSRWDEIMAVLTPIANAAIKSALERMTIAELADLEAMVARRSGS